MYCVYLTTYKGNLFPPFYVGSTSKSKLESGYVGSVASKLYKDLWKAEVKKNPNLFEVQVLSEHETRQDAFRAELEEQLRRDVVKSDLYVNRALARAEGRFSGIDQSGPKNPMFGKRTSSIARSKISKALAGVKKSDQHRENMKSAWQSRKPFSEEAKQNMRDARPRGEYHAFFGKKRPGVGAKVSATTSGVLWWNNGFDVIRARTSPGPEWARGKGEVWWNNGTLSTKSRSQPSPEWVRGRIKLALKQSSP